MAPAPKTAALPPPGSVARRCASSDAPAHAAAAASRAPFANTSAKASSTAAARPIVTSARARCAMARSSAREGGAGSPATGPAAPASPARGASGAAAACCTGAPQERPTATISPRSLSRNCPPKASSNSAASANSAWHSGEASSSPSSSVCSTPSWRLACSAAGLALRHGPPRFRRTRRKSRATFSCATCSRRKSSDSCGLPHRCPAAALALARSLAFSM
mmetsp:Transcript_53408/g.168069  ORF Transcript_53408/g.168069 Transcript_53408/m.168069 type:complete len:220 (-) Transcript_53408:398-1057(-)